MKTEQKNPPMTHDTVVSTVPIHTIVSKKLTIASNLTKKLFIVIILELVCPSLARHIPVGVYIDMRSRTTRLHLTYPTSGCQSKLRYLPHLLKPFYHYEAERFLNLSPNLLGGSCVYFRW